MVNRPSSGTVLSDRYELHDQLGAGGMAEVHLGRDRVLGRTVAVKTLHGQYAGDPQFIERFKREAQSAAALNHPNVVGVYDTGSDDGTYYIVMEYVEGRTLRDAIRDEGPLLPERAAELAAEVCEGLAYAHSRGIVHRDVKPANIMLTTNGGVKVADFGIARAISGDTVTQTAMVLGTAQYFSPEQAQSAPVDARSDIYSLGICLYEMLTRQVPFTGSSPVAIAYKHVKEDPILPSRLNGDVPPELEAIVMKAMSKNPNNRYQSADEMREDLLRALHGRPVQATPVLADVTGVIDPIGDETVVVERSGAVTDMRRTQPARIRTEEERRRRTGIILLAAILVAILGIAIWALAGILGGTAQIRVPDVVDLPQSQAQQILRDRGFDPEVTQPEPHPTIELGNIIRQDPEPDSLAAESSRVAITPSAGPERVEVPRVVGDTESQAREKIDAAGLEVGEVSRRADSEVPEGRVISQDPSGGFVTTDTKVNLVISSGPPTTIVPNVVGRSESDARFILESNGFRVQREQLPQGAECQQPEGFVCRQSPAPNERVQEGSTVTIFVAGPPEEPSPSPSPSPSPTPTETPTNNGNGPPASTED